MPMRDIIRIDENKCNGCGLCASACAEGAIKMIDGKAKLVREDYCDGLGACLGECPQGAIAIEKREAPAFNHPDAAVAEHQVAAPALAAAGCPGTQARQFVAAAKPAAPAMPASPDRLPCGCPGTAARQFARPACGCAEEKAETETPSALTHWPVQLKLINPASPAFADADLLLAADCAAVALGGFHGRLLAGRSVAIACPKLDDGEGYVEKLAQLLARARSVTVARMEVPCCGGLTRLARAALALSGRDLPLREVIIGVEGNITQDQE